jgi:phosphoribosylformylglycinamidine synthase
VGGEAPQVDLEHEARLQRFLVAAAGARLLRSAHDCSEGGLAVSLAEAAIGGPYAARGFGAIADLRTYAPRLAAENALYGEDPGRVVLSATPAALPGLRALLARHGLRGYLAGEVRAPGGTLDVVLPASVHRWPIDRLRAVYDDAIPRRMREVVTDRAEA